MSLVLSPFTYELCTKASLTLCHDLRERYFVEVFGNVESPILYIGSPFPTAKERLQMVTE